jgi:hypothetical protein
VGKAKRAHRDSSTLASPDVGTARRGFAHPPHDAQANAAVDSDIRSNLLPGESPMFSGGRR